MRPGVERVAGRAIQFADGRTLRVDTLIAATGYELDLPFLSAEVSPVVERRLDAYGRVVHPDWPGLYFVGFFNVSGGANIAMMDVQSAWVTALESGTAGLPSPRRMRRGMARERRVLARRFPQSARYGLELDPARYRRQVAKELRRRPARRGGRR